MKKIKLKPLTIGKWTFETPVFAAPLAGFSDKAYRRILKEEGCPLVFSEMVSAKALLYDNLKSQHIINIRGETKPVGVQIFGKDSHEVSEGAKRIEAIGADIIDFNMGCPAPKIVKNGEGSALLKNPQLAIEILATLVKSVSIPITLKIRKGFNDIEGDSIPIIKGAEAVGVKAIFLHGRTKEQYYSGTADWQSIRKAKEAVSIPVIGNGDVTNPIKAEVLLAETGCDGVLIGRGFLGNPFLFKYIEDYFKTGLYKERNFAEKVEVALRQLKYAVEDKGEELAVREMRKQIVNYFKGIKNGAYYRNQFNQCTIVREITKEINEILESVVGCA
ncbi:hypothetical protein AZF37_07800 [endosymbiont 'TC1' of Trimyema compressum]|uniref:tRNA dihydrouridine synthase DusB n=1 Tax=endosymbiont 'TC1' of Trimyema compressum TaxID=243899 RepID=UPI0007F0E22D|nr:tRNA dihydrouridine synthase DusB [endosymbiont 'TC1' of Trimyema compressum]AMP21082.1 hypothetical protein AZF37_07800 [endosymbiont 'TC1' of Trimyema compressum]